MAGAADMCSFAARLATFQAAHQLSKRRASVQNRKRGANTIEWPHAQPPVEELARAGFFYRPTVDSLDNVQCYLCTVKLDGWEPTDAPLREHLAHSPSCAWALSLSVAPSENGEIEARDPMSEELQAARRGTFESGFAWPHKGKRGWRCKISRMVESGWVFDPSPEADDGVTCFYCNLSLDGWEPKDDPYEEHQRRSPDCTFFSLCERYHGTNTAKPKNKRGKARGSTASRTSRLSTQSAVTVDIEDPAVVGAGETGTAGDDSLVSNATVTSQATGKGKKTKAGPKPAKGGKGRKRANTVGEDAESEVLPPSLSELSESRQSQLPGSFPESSLLSLPDQPISQQSRSSRPTKNAASQSHQTDSSVVEISQTDMASKKNTRGRKAKANSQPEPEPSVKQRLSEASAQLQRELEDSLADQDAPDHESTPQPPPPVTAKAKRGVKRTSDGARKVEQIDSSIVMGLEFPAPPAKLDIEQQPKKKRGRPSKQTQQAEAIEHLAGNVDQKQREEIAVMHPASQASQVGSDPELERPITTKKVPAKKTKGKKASSIRSSKTSVSTKGTEAAHEPEDLARDEAEIEAELARIAAEQSAVKLEQDNLADYEPSPSHIREQDAQMQILEDEVQAEHGMDGGADGLGNVLREMLVPALRPATTTPSPSSSDKENNPSSVLHPATSTALKLRQASPTRIPLAPSTPNRSPQKQIHRQLSPTKQALFLTSTQPWQPIDLDAVFLTSPQPTSGTLAQRLVQASGVLTSPEKKMTVEEWVRWRAEQGEAELRRRCEGLVEVFEREGNRGLGVLAGIGVIS